MGLFDFKMIIQLCCKVIYRMANSFELFFIQTCV